MKKKTRHLISISLFPVILCYFEVVFRLSTSGQLFQGGSVFTLLACVSLGLVCYLLNTLFSGKKAGPYLAAGLSFLLALPYLVEYFIYRQFKIFYDLNTTLGGAADAATGFTDDIMALIFSWDGFFKITLFLLPAILVLIFVRKRKLPLKSNGILRCITGSLAVIALMLLLIGLLVIPEYALLAQDHYSFQSAVDTFGLVSGVGLDLNHILTAEEEGFENVQIPVITPPPTTLPPTTPAPTEPDSTTAPPTTPAPTEPPVVYVPNQLDIDFSSLTTQGQLGDMNAYVAAQIPTMTNEYTGIFQGKNLILICAEAFSHAVIDPVRTPTLYRMATKGMQFTDYYQPDTAGTTGGEYQLIFGMPPTNGGMSFKDTVGHNNYFTLGSQLDRLGYWGRAYHNNEYTYYSRHKTHINLGYSDGYVGFGNGMELYIKEQWPESDLEMFQGSVDDYLDKQPFNVYYMTVSGHSSYTLTGNCMVKKHWDRVAELDYSDRVKGYLACQMELEDSMTFLLARLEEAGIADDTVIVITADHFPYGIDETYSGRRKYTSELYGYPVTTTMEQDRSALIIWSGCLEDREPIVVDTPTCSLDILPTVSNLFGTKFDSRLFVGRDVFSDAQPLVFNNNYDWKTEYGTYIRGEFTPISEDLVLPEGYVDAVCATVRNKLRFCRGVLSQDYFDYLYEQGQLD